MVSFPIDIFLPKVISTMAMLKFVLIRYMQTIPRNVKNETKYRFRKYQIASGAAIFLKPVQNKIITNSAVILYKVHFLTKFYILLWWRWYFIAVRGLLFLLQISNSVNLSLNNWEYIKLVLVSIVEQIIILFWVSYSYYYVCRETFFRRFWKKT